MKTSSITPSRYGCSIGIINALLTAVLTVLSFQYIEPKNCYRFCETLPCPAGGCRFGDQKAGWPLPVFIDYPGGGSPTNGWGLIGPEDPALFVPLILDIGFYNLMIWLVMWVTQLIPWKTFPAGSLQVSLLLNILFAVSLWIISWRFGVTIGRGQSIQVYIDTPIDRYAVSGFFPSFPITVEEMIQTYGSPDEVWINSAGSMGTSSLLLVLHWNSSDLFVQLPEISDHLYFVNKTTRVKMIVFFQGEPIGENKTPWRGYGTYQRQASFLTGHVPALHGERSCCDESNFTKKHAFPSERYGSKSPCRTRS